MLAGKLKDSGLVRHQCYIDGRWQAADSGQTIDVTNPATGEVIATVPKMESAETRRTIEAAGAAQPAWRAKTAAERCAVVRRWYESVMARQEDLAIIMTAEPGKPLGESRAEGSNAAWSASIPA